MMSPAVWRNSQGNACSSLHLFNNFDQATWEAEHPVAFLASYTVANSPVKFYAIHGTEDTVVPPADVEAFVEKLSQVAEVEYVPYEGGIHAWTTWKETCREALKYAGKVLQA